MAKKYKLIGRNGELYDSEAPGKFGGHRKDRIYGRLDCPSALRALANGHYKQQRVFFADEITALSVGFRPCAKCLPHLYAGWKSNSSEWRELRMGTLLEELEIGR
jgi:methylphosphotriester-DNA--protein-cysteine methyltransferase